MLFGATVRSPHARARIRAIRWRPERAPEGSVCVTAADLPGPNAVLLIQDDWLILADGEVRHIGEPVALVAAPTRLAARRAMAAVEVDYEPLPAVVDLADAAAEPPLTELELAAGDPEQALAQADRVVEGTYRCGHQEHIYIECNVMTAWSESDGTVVVAGSMQCPYYVHKSLVHGLALGADEVRVKANAVGGGFGGKEDYPSMIALHAALLSRASGKPVRLAYDRHEDIVGTTKRHPAVVSHRTAVDGKGRLLAMAVDVTMDGGAYTTLSPVVLSRAVLHAGGAYRCPNVRIRGRVLRTNTATNGAFRGFGAPQTQFAIERHMDRIARAVGVDPLELRRLNLLRPGDSLPTGQVLDETTAASECLEKVEELTGFQARWRALEEERDESRGSEPQGPAAGLGLSLFFHGAGFTGNGERRMKSPVTVRLDDAGRVEVLTAMTDMGQGCAAIFPQIACEAGGLTEDDVVFAEPDTGRVPDSGPTVASRTTMVVGGTIARAVVELRDRVLEWWSAKSGRSAEVVEGRFESADGSSRQWAEVAREYLAESGPLEITLRHEPPAWQSFDESSYRGDAYPTFGWGAEVVEVEIDPDTFEVRPQRATVVCEVGKAIHPTLCAGQIEGGTLQALGWALMEEIKLEGGRYLNDRLATYIIPTAKDSPRIDVHLLERPWKEGPFGAKGVGELPMDGGAPATLSAIECATGLAVDEIPATPERLLAASRESGS